MPFCSQCGNEVRVNARFCNRCGSETGQDQPSEVQETISATSEEQEKPRQNASPPQAPRSSQLLTSRQEPDSLMAPQQNQESTPSGKRKALKWGGIGCGGLFGLFMLVGIIGAICSGGAPLEVPTPAPTVPPTQEPVSAYPVCEEPEEKVYIEAQASNIALGIYRVDVLDEVVSEIIRSGADPEHQYVRKLLQIRGDEVKDAQKLIKNYKDVPSRMQPIDEKAKIMADAMNEYQKDRQEYAKAKSGTDAEKTKELYDRSKATKTDIRSGRNEIISDIREVCGSVPDTLIHGIEYAPMEPVTP